MNKTFKKVLAVSASAVVACASVAPAFAEGATWGDTSGKENGRDTYTIDQINSGALGDSIVMNSIVDKDGALYDERNFVAARLDNGDNGAKNVWNENEIVAEDGKDYIVRMYVHNNSPKGTEAIATGVLTTFAIDQSASTSIKINGLIETENANPADYWDSVIFRSADGSNFHLEYYEGSALLENNGIGKNGGIKLSDKIVTEGTLIGYDALDGRVPGCYQYANYVTIKVKAVYDTDYTVSKQVRKAGTKDAFTDEITAEIGDQVEFQITYKNTSDGQQDDVTVVDKMPTNLKYIEGSTKLYNGQVSGLTAEDTLTTEGIAIGSYAAHSSAVIRYTAEVVDNDLGCGDTPLNNWVQISINGKIVKDDNAIVNTSKVCYESEEPDEPEEIVKTGADVAGAVLGAGSLTTALGYYISSRKNLKK